ncbi:MAG: lysine biosynthesis protein LysW [Patescibacteria group bacterium]
MQTARCPVCNSDVIVEDGVYEHDLVDCANCEAQLEIISLHPLQLLELSSEDENGPEKDDFKDE